MCSGSMVFLDDFSQISLASEAMARMNSAMFARTECQRLRDGSTCDGGADLCSTV